MEADPRDVGRLQEILYSLYLMLTFHLQREEDVYMRLATSHKEIGVRRLLDEVSRERYEQGARRIARRTPPVSHGQRASPSADSVLGSAPEAPRGEPAPRAPAASWSSPRCRCPTARRAPGRARSSRSITAWFCASAVGA